LDDKELGLWRPAPGTGLLEPCGEGNGIVHGKPTATPEVFDREQAMAATGGDQELLVEIVGLFLEDCPQMVAEIGRALAAADLDAARRAAHTLKGSVAVLGAQALAAAAREVEDLVRGGDLDGARSAQARVEQEAKRLLPLLEELLAG